MNTLREAVSEYITMRRGLGFKLHAAGHLENFVSLEQHDASFITTDMALKWAQQPASIQPVTWANRLTVVRGFARFRSATDPRTEIPGLNLLPHKPRRAKPYLYTDCEIQQLMQAALNLPGASFLERRTYNCLLGLLFVSGMRISEVIGLKISKVDLDNGVLTIEGAKKGRSRLVPVHETTQQVLSGYKRLRNETLKGRISEYFFISDAGHQLNVCTVRHTFYRLSRQIGLPQRSKGEGPRLHDARHRFAIETLLRWYRNSENVELGLPALSTYLGHTNISHTYWYLTACPELMGLAVQRLELRWEGES